MTSTSDKTLEAEQQAEMGQQSMECPLCCPSCASQPKSHLRPGPSDPLALSNFLPAGVIQISAPSQRLCRHSHAEDGWHPFTKRPYASEGKELYFLVEHKFIYATCQLTGDGDFLTVRVYIIPYDLARYGGKLRNRDEAKVVAPARKILRTFLPKIVQDPELWKGRRADASSSPKTFLPLTIDNRTMAELYGNLPSPDFPPCGPIAGLRSQLYEYQRRSVSALQHKESSTAPIPDPLYIPVVGMNGTTFYLQPNQMEFLRSRPHVSTNCGGILCEELGTGKTVMILALILSTLDGLPSPEVSLDDPHAIMTPLAFRHFPGEPYQGARSKLGRTEQIHAQPAVPSFVEMLFHKIRVCPVKSALRQHEDVLVTGRMSTPILANSPFYLHYPPYDPTPSRAKRQGPELGPRLMYLASATLVIVPKHLQAQWRSEITKHCTDNALRYLVVTNQTIFPRARVLASDYDLILMTHDRFSREAARNNVSALHSWAVCTCRSLSDSRVPICQCPGHPEASPLLQIRWKRLVIDEGHVSANIVANLTSFSKLLSVERKWIVTGTPTTNLLGLSSGRSSEVLGGSADPAPLEDEEDEDRPVVARQWNDYDREDLRKLASMMIHFLGVPSFTAQPKLFDTQVMAPLLDVSGPLPGAIQILVQVMNMQMVRHRVEEVEAEVALPPVTKEEVFLDLDPYVIKSYNAFQAGLAINAIDSEREDQDYMFHASNVAQLRTAAANLSQLTFWSVADGLYNVDEIHSRQDERIRTAQRRMKTRAKITPEDFGMLQQVGRHVASIVGDELWRAIQKSESVPFLVSGLPPEVLRAWTRTPGRPVTAGHLPPGTAFVHPERLVQLRQCVLAQPLLSAPALVELGDEVCELEGLRMGLRSPAKKGRKGKSVMCEDEEVRGKDKALAAATKMASKEKEMVAEMTAVQARLRMEEEDPEMADRRWLRSLSSSRIRDGVPNSFLLARSLLASVRVHSSASSKLNYILNEVVKYSKTEKFLIFSQYPLSLSHVGDALDLLRVKYVSLTAQVQPRIRESSILTFETCDVYRVMLLDTKFARGLNLITASRIIFCEPVWQADVESQAIKRAHRIGQTRPVIAKVLVIRDTSEHFMMERRKALKSSGGVIPPQFHQEIGMRNFIEHPTFISEKPTLLPSVEFPLLDLPPRQKKTTAAVAVNVGGGPEAPAEKRRRIVSFADGGAIRLGPMPPSSGERSQDGKSRVVRFAVDDDDVVVSNGSPPVSPLSGQKGDGERATGVHLTNGAMASHAAESDVEMGDDGAGVAETGAVPGETEATPHTALLHMAQTSRVQTSTFSHGVRVDQVRQQGLPSFVTAMLREFQEVVRRE